MTFRYAISTFLYLSIALPASAASVTDGSLRLGFEGTRTLAELKRPDGTVESKPDSRPGPSIAESRINDVDPVNGNEFATFSQQKPNGDVALEYQGQWINPITGLMTEYTGEASIVYQLTNLVDARELSYTYTIDDTYITLMGGGSNGRNDPFSLGRIGPGLGAELFHQISVDGAPIKTSVFRFWTYFPTPGASMQYVKGNAGIEGDVIEEFEIIGDPPKKYTLGYTAFIPRQTTTVNLGLFGAADTKRVEVSMRIRALHDAETSVSMAFNDPGDFESVFGPASPTPSAVPLPAAGWMLLGGLGGLAAIRRRRSKVPG